MKLPEVGKTYRSIKKGRPTYVREISNGYVYWSTRPGEDVPVYSIKLENFWKWNEDRKKIKCRR